MTDLRKAAELALETLEWSWGGEPLGTKEFEAIQALRQALAQPEPWDTSDMAHRAGGLTVEQSIKERNK